MPSAAAAAVGAQRLQGQAVAEQQVVRAPAPRRRGWRCRARNGRSRGRAWAMTQGSLCVVMAATRSPRRRSMPRRVVDEAVHGVARRPAAVVLQRLRQVPVVQRQVGPHAAREQAVDQPFVEVQALGIPGAAAGGLHPRPADREAVGVDAQRGDEVEVAAQAVDVVAGDVAIAAVGDGAGLAAEAVPDRLALAVGGGGALRSGRRWSPRPRRSRRGNAAQGRRARAAGRGRTAMT